MDTLISSPASLLHSELFRRVLKRSVRVVVSGADHAGVYKHQLPHNLQILRPGKARSSLQPSPFFELIGVLEGVRSQLSFVHGNKVGRSSLDIQANSGECVFVDVSKTLGLGQRKPSGAEPDDEKHCLTSCRDDHSEVELETRAADAEDSSENGTFQHGEYENSERESTVTIAKKAGKKNVARDGTSESMETPTEEQTTEDEEFMTEALLEAKKAASIGEVPVGAVIVQKGRIVARAYNRVEAEGDPTAHAEILCIGLASRAIGDWRLTDATIYVTMEPCPMCAGALLQARVKRVVWGARNHLLGADGSWVSLFPSSQPHQQDARRGQHPFHKTVEVRRQLLSDDCSFILRSFFRSRRKGEVPVTKRKPWWLSFEFWVLLRKLLG